MRRFLVILSIGLVLSGCSRKGPDEAAADDPATPVEIMTVPAGTIEQVVDFFGNVIPDQAVKVYSTIPNRIVSLRTDIGQRVQAGEILAVIEAEKITQAVVQAEAGLEAAQAQYRNVNTEWRRIKKLFDEQVISQSQLDAVQAQREAAAAAVKQMEATLATARSQLRDTRITAPISGTIAGRTLDAGDLAVPQIPLFEIVQMDPVRITINVIERYINLIRPGQTARVSVASSPDTLFSGYVVRLNPTLNPLSRTATAEITVANPGHLLKPGMFAQVRIILQTKTGVPVIPRHVIVEKTQLRGDQGRLTTGNVQVDRFVFVLQEDWVRKAAIQTGIEQDNLVEITSGLQAGQNIVSLGQNNLSDSTRVMVVNR